jgi:hypothetical protein
MEACYGETDVMERSCAVARGIDINPPPPPGGQKGPIFCLRGTKIASVPKRHHP